MEESNTVLNISVYDVVRNETARTHRQELERRLAEEEQIRREKEKDYLAPFLARIGDPPELSIEQKRTVPEVSRNQTFGWLVGGQVCGSV